MTATPDLSAAPAEVTFKVVVTRRQPDGRGGFSQLASGELASDQAIEFVEEQRDLAAADGLVQRSAETAPDPTAAASADAPTGPAAPAAPDISAGQSAGEPL